MERATRSDRFDRLFSAKVKYRLEIYALVLEILSLVLLILSFAPR